MEQHKSQEKELNLVDSVIGKGTNERRLFGNVKLKELLEKKTGLSFDAAYTGAIAANGERIISFDALLLMASDARVSGKDLSEMLDQSAKVLFADNKLWKFIRIHFNKDIKIPYITGKYTKDAVKANLIVTTGHAGYSGQIGGSTATPFAGMAYGTGVVAAAAGDTVLGAEVARGAATVSQITTSTTNDTCQWAKTFTAAGTQTITEEGLFNNNVSGGTLLARQVFAGVPMLVNDTLAFTHKIQS